MKKHLLVGSLAISAALILAACSDNNESEPDNNVENSENAEDNGENSSTSELNPDAEPAVDEKMACSHVTIFKVMALKQPTAKIVIWWVTQFR